MSETDELADLPEEGRLATIERVFSNSRHEPAYVNAPAVAESPIKGSYQQWSAVDGTKFVACGATRKTLEPGLYSINVSPSIGLYFEAVPIRTEGLLRLPHTNSDAVLSEIEAFWSKADKFKEYQLPHKRGILLYGPPGSGKTSTVSLLMRDVIHRGGIGIKFENPTMFAAGYRAFRQIQPTTPLVALMEDLDEIIRAFSESEVLNILDGAEEVRHVVFVASTNYPEMLGARIVNRPSRFDRRFRVAHPSAESRAVYLNYLSEGHETGIDVEKWTADTDGMSLAHLKELFVAVVVLEDDYEKALKLLKGMKEKVSSDKDRDSYMGYQA